MAAETYAVIENGTVINVVLWDGQTEWAPPVGSTAVVIPEGAVAGIGYTYANAVFITPTLPMSTN